eukprot:COSAG02_NODE_2791_length_8022_cov_5.437208_4_plen_110_part_00
MRQPALRARTTTWPETHAIAISDRRLERGSSSNWEIQLIIDTSTRILRSIESNCIEFPQLESRLEPRTGMDSRGVPIDQPPPRGRAPATISLAPPPLNLGNEGNGNGGA